MATRKATTKTAPKTAAKPAQQPQAPQVVPTTRIPRNVPGTAKLAVTAAGSKYNGGRVAHNQAAWAAVCSGIKAGLTVGGMVALANKQANHLTANTGPYIGYAVKNGWVKVAAS